MDLHELDEADQQQFMRESSQLSAVMLDLFGGYKMNVAALGNVVAQLHVHHIVRREEDPAWPRPVWGNEPAVAYAPAEIERLIGTIRQAVLSG